MTTQTFIKCGINNNLFQFGEFDPTTKRVSGIYFFGEVKNDKFTISGKDIILARYAKAVDYSVFDFSTLLGIIELYMNTVIILKKCSKLEYLGEFDFDAIMAYLRTLFEDLFI